MECKDNQKVMAIYLFNKSDWLYDNNGFPYKMKRKYGNFDRFNALKIIK